MDATERDKAELRRLIRRTLAARDEAELKQESVSVCERALSMPELSRARAVLAYAPMAKADGAPDRRRELDVWPLVQGLLGRKIGVGLPAVDWDRSELEPKWMPAGRPDAAREVVVRRHGVPEPPEGRAGWSAAQVWDFDVLIVPGAAFDASGGRLGRGGGFYDRLLSRVGPAVFVVGVAYDEQVVERVPTAVHDARVHAVVTPSRILRPGATEGPDRVR